MFVGAVSDADKITIMLPSIRGLMRLCESYASEYHPIFNEHNSVAIKFGHNSKTDCHVLIKGGLCWKSLPIY